MSAALVVGAAATGLGAGAGLGAAVERLAAPWAGRRGGVAVLTAAGFAAVGARFGASTTMPGELVFVAGLVVLACCDLATYRLPNLVVWPTGVATGAALVGAAAAGGEWRRLGVAAACGAAEFALFAALNAVNPRWLGFGDVRLGSVIGLALGWVGPATAVAGLVIANLVGAVVGVALVAAGRANRRTPLPFGVFLAVGAVVALVVPSW